MQTGVSKRNVSEMFLRQNYLEVIILCSIQLVIFDKAIDMDGC